MTIEVAILICVMLMTGLISGVIAGLLGVGGGIVIVPVLEIMLSIVGIDSSVRMHVAVGTSLGIIMLTSLSSARAHYLKKSVLIDVISYWGPTIAIGAFIGTLIAGRLNTDNLYALFGIMAFIVSIKMLFLLEEKTVFSDIPRGILGIPIPFGIGFLSVLMGIGGGSMSVPILTLCGKDIRDAIGTSALCGAFIAFPGTIGFIFTGLNNPLLPFGHVGYINWIGLFLIVPAAILSAPVGAKIVHNVNRRTVTLIFGIFLMLISSRMLWRVFYPL